MWFIYLIPKYAKTPEQHLFPGDQFLRYHNDVRGLLDPFWQLTHYPGNLPGSIGDCVVYPFIFCRIFPLKHQNHAVGFDSVRQNLLSNRGRDNAFKGGPKEDYKSSIPRIKGYEHTKGSKDQDIYFDVSQPWPNPTIEKGRYKGKKLSEAPKGYLKSFLTTEGIYLSESKVNQIKFKDTGKTASPVEPTSNEPDKIVVSDERRTDYTQEKVEGVPPRAKKEPEITVEKPKKGWKPKVTEKGGNIHVDYSDEPAGEISIPDFKSAGFSKFTKKDLEMGNISGPLQDAVNTFNKEKQNIISESEKTHQKAVIFP